MTDIVESTDSPSNDIANLVRRLCEKFAIAYSGNRVFPILADVARRGETSIHDQLRAVGVSFGFRFRDMEGSLGNLIDVLSDRGPVLLETTQDSPLLLLSVLKRGKFLVHFQGSDQRVTKGWLKKMIGPTESEMMRWLVVQPMLAAEHASRFHYPSGTSIENLKPLRRFIEFLKPEAKDIRTVFIFSIVIGLLSLTTPLAVEAVVNTIAFGKYLQPLVILSFIVLVFLGFRAVLNVLMTIVTEIIQRKLFVRTVEDLSYRLTRVPLSVWKKYHGPELLNRFFDIVSIQKITSKLLLETLMLFLQTIIGLTVLAFYHPFLLGYDIGLLVMMSIVLWFIGRGAVKTAREESQLKYETGAWLQEIVRHPSTFKFNGGLGFAINRADELVSSYINYRQGHFNILVRQISFSMTMQVVAATVLLALGGYLVIEGQMTLGQLVAAELIVTVILGSFAKLGKDLESFYDLMASVDKLGKLFDLPIGPANKLQLARFPGAYRLSLVDFNLTNSQAKTASFDFEPSESVSVTGNSELVRGNFIEVITGQSKPATGYAMLNGFRVDSLSAESLQSKVSLIREIEIFEGTVAENIRMGRQDIGSVRVNEIVETLGLQKVISGLSEGFATRLSVCGYPISPCDAVRLVLARAFISKPGILFIDGLLDRLSDQDIEDILPRIEKLKKETTLVISTGRYAISKWSDRQLNFDNSNLELVV